MNFVSRARPIGPDMLRSSTIMQKPMRTVFVLAMIILAPTAIGQKGREWQDLLADSSTALKSGDYRRALRISNRVVDEMVEMLGPGDAATQVFGIALTHKALANAGTGNADDALWYWYTAISLYPDMAQTDLSVFGSAGQFLKDHPLPPVESGRRLGDSQVTPPKLLKRVAPEFPAGARAFGISGVLVVEVVIDKSGHTTSPRVRRPLPAPTLSYTALEAVKRWRFEPGTVNGEAVPVLFNLTVNYKLP
jgi:TonB family protein